MNDKATWLAGLRPGDEVAVLYPGIGAVPQKRHVERRTQSGRVVVDGSQYDGGTGFERGGRRLIRQWVNEDDNDQKRRALAGKLLDVRWRDLPLETLERVAAALEVSP
jgi:hypothetical protein